MKTVNKRSMKHGFARDFFVNREFNYIFGMPGCGKSTTLAVVAQVYRHLYRVFGHGHQKHVLKRACRALCLGIAEPFLEERGERVAIDGGAGLVVAHGQLAVSLYR